MNNFGNAWIDWAIAKPRRVVMWMLGSTLLAVVFATLPTLIPGGLGPLPTIAVDVDPENMLEPDEPARLIHEENKRRFGLHDAVVVGIVNDAHEDGVFNPGTLSAMHRLTKLGKDLPGVVAHDVMSLSTVDSIEHTGPGTVSFDWLMPSPPTDAATAAEVRRRAERIPFLRDTLFSADGKALVVYLPLEDKSFAHDVAGALRATIANIEPSVGEFHIAGLPVAEETFGIEMFVQMGISAPLAMLVIFVLMWLYFRRVIVIISPMIVALAAVFGTMGLLVLTGNTIHIMSSMIPIFIMPIAVLDGVHIISDFFDRYDPAVDRRQTIRSVMQHLFSPMLFTSMTTAAGFASLALTPIPPVRVFGLFVAVGVVLAWLWTILFVPAFLMSLSSKHLKGFGRLAKTNDGKRTNGGFLGLLDRFTHRHAKLVVVGAMLALGGSAYGIQQIVINDNPTRWFEPDHPIRVADRELNAHFGGTYDAFLTLGHAAPTYSAAGYAESLKAQAEAFEVAIKAQLEALASSVATGGETPPLDVIETHERELREVRRAATDAATRAAANAGLDLLAEAFDAADGETPPAAEGYRTALAEQIRVRARAITAAFGEVSPTIDAVVDSAPASAPAMLAALDEQLGANDAPARRPLAAFVGSAAQSDEVFKQPAMLSYLEGLQRHLDETAAVGKSSSVADIVKTVHRDLLTGEQRDYRIPDSASVVAQTLDQYQSSHRKDDLWHFVTPDYQKAVVWLQLTSGDNTEMESVVAAARDYFASHPAPIEVSDPEWFGLTYINVVWQEQMVAGMLNAFLGSFLVVLAMMALLFRSLLWGFLSMVPLTVTVAVIYGLIGLVGKDYDMPVAVLSSLSLGLAVDYAIHFLARSRDLVAIEGSWEAARSVVFGEPARAISRNIVVVGVGFLPLLLAPLVPYQTVGILIASILLLAGLASLVLLPSLIVLLRRSLFPNEHAEQPSTNFRPVSHP